MTVIKSLVSGKLIAWPPGPLNRVSVHGKQALRNRKKDWEHQCALISPNILLKLIRKFFIGNNRSASFFRWQFCCFVGFWSNLAPENCFYKLILKFFNFIIQYLNPLQLSKTFCWQHVNFPLKKLINGCKSVFHECEEEEIKVNLKKMF